MIMVSHNIVHCFDSKNPASISPKVNKYIRNTMGFKGVIVTDSLSMAGVRSFTGSEGESAVRAVQAGDDLLCTEHYKRNISGIASGLQDKTDIEKNGSMHLSKRILMMKYRRGLNGRFAVRRR